MSIHIYREELHTTGVSNRFIDELMPEANGEFVKVYLYLLRSVTRNNKECTVSGIADALNNTEADVMRALRYWERADALSLDVDGGEICGIRLIEENSAATATRSSSSPLPPQVPAAVCDSTVELSVPRIPPADMDDTRMPVLSRTAAPLPPADADVSFRQPIPEPADKDEAHTLVQTRLVVSNTAGSVSRREYTPDELDNFMNDDSVSELLGIVQAYLGARPLTSSDMSTVLFWYDELHLPRDLIIYLVESCVGSGHTSLYYMNKIALVWNEKNITSVDQARQESDHHNMVYYGVQKAFGISGRNLGKKENDYLKKWNSELSFDLPIILEACNRTMSAIHQPSFEYADRILTAWHKHKVHSLDDIKALDKNYQATRKNNRTASADNKPRKTGFSNFDQRNYDFDELEKMLLNTSV